MTASIDLLSRTHGIVAPCCDDAEALTLVATEQASFQLSDFNGFWQVDSRAFSSFYSFLVINTVTFPNTISVFPGPVEYIRGNIYNNDPNLNARPVTYSFGPDGSLRMVALGPGTALGLLGTTAFSLSPDKNTLYGFLPNATAFPINSIYLRQSGLPASLIQWNESPEEIDWNQAPPLLKYYYDSVVLNTASFVPKKLGNDQFNFETVTKAFEKYYRGESITYSTKITDIIRSNNVGNVFLSQLITFRTIPPYKVTYLLLKDNPFNYASIVTISGFKGAWNILNGTHKIDPTLIGDVNVPCKFFPDRAVRYFVALQIDTINLPKYCPEEHGRAKIESTVQGLTATSEYRELVDALLDIQRLQGNNKQQFIGYFIGISELTAGRPLFLTYQEMRDALANPTSPTVFVRATTTGTGGIAYTYAFNNASFYFSIITSPEFNNANKFDIDVRNPLYNTYLLPLNYIKTDTFFEVFGQPSSTPSVTGYNFVVGLSPYVGGTVPAGFARTQILSGAFPRGFLDIPTFGLIKPEFTGGRKIGYLHLASYNQQIIGMNATANNPPTDPNYNIKKYNGTMMQYLVTTLGVEDIIFDQRDNVGGLINNMAALGSTFGTLRQGFDLKYSFVGPPDRPIYTQNDNFDSPIPLKSPFTLLETIDPAIVTSIVPGSNFIGEGKRVALIHSIEAVRAADWIVSYFIGDNLDRNIGGGVHARIYGTMDGRVAGVNPFSYNAPTNRLNPAIRTPTGGFFSPFIYGTDSEFVPQNRAFPKPQSRFSSLYTPDIVLDPSFDVLYRDLGYLPAKRDYRVGPPIPTVQTSWADTWLEIVLDDLLGKNKSR